MTITANDLKFFAAAYPNDTPAGGGRMTSTAIQTSVENNVFPDVDAAARASGRVQLRKVFAAVTSSDADALMAAQVSFASGSIDPGVDVVAFLVGDGDTLRSGALTDLQLRSLTAGQAIGNGVAIVVTNSQPTQFVVPAGAATAPVAVGALVSVGAFVDGGALSGVVSVTGSAGNWLVTLADPVVLPAYNGSVAYLAQETRSALTYAGTAKTTATASGTTARLDRLMGRVVPAITPFPGTVQGLVNTGDLQFAGGRVPIFRAGCSVVIRNGATSEVARVAAVDWSGGLTFSAALANIYPAGSLVGSLLDLGDMQAAVTSSFSQQTWTRSFSDSITGNPISANYDTLTGSIATTNLGAESERWAIVFTSTSAFNLIGEHLGQIAAGTIGTAFAPLNPITNSPYFTISPAGWGTGWAIGNVLRLNTTGARAPIWLARCVSPSGAAALNTPSLELRGTVNA